MDRRVHPRQYIVNIKLPYLCDIRRLGKRDAAFPKLNNHFTLCESHFGGYVLRIENYFL